MSKLTHFVALEDFWVDKWFDAGKTYAMGEMPPRFRPGGRLWRQMSGYVELIEPIVFMVWNGAIHNDG